MDSSDSASRRLCALLVTIGLGLLAPSTEARAQERCHGSAAEDVAPGAERPASLPALVDVEDRSVDVALFVQQHELTVLFWYAASCPCVERYQQRIEQIAEEFAQHDVVVVGIDSNADDDLEALQTSIAERGFVLPVLRDVDAQLAAILGVRSTPTVVVLDSNAEVVFRGWIDNERQPGQRGREPWLEDALNAALSGEGGESIETPVFGCAVTRRRR